ncbi:hypothetical protein, partial [Akkermansia sp.]|uniref:hypothetical protein n=1 Tax=Akkermansia sp. TaxID=1872421 RepID=UPI003A904F16
MTRLDRNPSGLRSFFTDLFHIQQLYHSAPRQKKGSPAKAPSAPFRSTHVFILQPGRIPGVHPSKGRRFHLFEISQRDAPFRNASNLTTQSYDQANDYRRGLCRMLRVRSGRAAAP